MTSNLFQKEEGDLTLRPIEAKPDDSLVDESESDIITLDGFSKEEGTLDPTLFIIISGGEVREKDYFSLLKEKNGFTRVRVKFLDEDEDGKKGLSPDQMLPLAQKVKTKYDEGKGEDLSDHIYLVSDVDHFRSELLRIKPICEEEGMQLIISNCSIEVWLYYGKRSEKPSNFEIPGNHLEISSAFKTYLGLEVKGGVNPRKAIFDVEVAIANAEKNYEEDAEGIPCLFSTQMYSLMQDILPLIKEELEALKEKNQKKAEMYKLLQKKK
jgi:hypothetical protein